MNKIHFNFLTTASLLACLQPPDAPPLTKAELATYRFQALCECWLHYYKALDDKSVTNFINAAQSQGLWDGDGGSRR